MIIIMERNATKVQIQRVIDFLKDNDFQVRRNVGEIHTVIDAIGDKTTITPGRLAAFEGVKEVKVIREPFRLASRDRNPEDTVIEFKNGVKIGGNNKPVFMVGPCSVEADYDGLLEIATAAKEMGCEFLRGGRFHGSDAGGGCRGGSVWRKSIQNASQSAIVHRRGAGNDKSDRG